jgi:DNA primase
MRFPPQFLDELRARLPVSEVVGRRVKLKRAGREFKGLSPFNQEKSPSFTVNDQNGFYHDFSSGKHGDIFGFVMETEGVTFPEAVERLASMAGLPMPKVSREEEQRDERRRNLHDVVELAG